MKKNILVTGGAGYIGSVLVGELLASGYAVTILDRFMFGGESLLAYLHNKNLTIIAGDIRDKKIVCKALKNIFAVIHLAALVGEPACRENTDVTRAINLNGAIDLAREAKKANVSRFVMVSTCSNYGVSNGSEEATEESELHPLSLYAETKIAAEKVILSLKNKSFHPTAVRLATIFGLAPKMRFNLMVNEFAREAAINGKISVINKDAWRPFLHVSDAAQAFIKIISAPVGKIDGEIFNVVSENVQKKQIAQMVKKKNSKVLVTMQPGKLDDKRDYRVSAKKIMKRLDFKPRFSVEDGFIEMIEAVKKGIFLDTDEFRYNAWFDEKVFKDNY
jgi:nucleoside-diphosphate-sugar epimerase